VTTLKLEKKIDFYIVIKIPLNMNYAEVVSAGNFPRFTDYNRERNFFSKNRIFIGMELSDIILARTTDLIDSMEVDLASLHVTQDNEWQLNFPGGKIQLRHRYPEEKPPSSTIEVRDHCQYKLVGVINEYRDHPYLVIGTSLDYAFLEDSILKKAKKEDGSILSPTRYGVISRFTDLQTNIIGMHHHDLWIPKHLKDEYFSAGRVRIYTNPHFIVIFPQGEIPENIDELMRLKFVQLAMLKDKEIDHALDYNLRQK